MTAGLFAALMSFAAVYAWHWWFVGRHRDKSANDRLRWRIDRALLQIGFGVLGFLLFLLVVGAALGMYDSWRLDRYGVTGTATVERIEQHRRSDSIVVTVQAGDGVRRIEVEGDGDEVAIGDSVAIVYDPDPDHNEGVLAGRSPYNRWPIFMLVGAAVLGFFVLTRTGRATIMMRGLRHWTDSRGRLRRPPG